MVLANHNKKENAMAAPLSEKFVCAVGSFGGPAAIVVYRSHQDARADGFNPAAIRKCLAGVQSIHAGVRFRLLTDDQIAAHVEAGFVRIKTESSL